MMRRAKIAAALVLIAGGWCAVTAGLAALLSPWAWAFSLGLAALLVGFLIARDALVDELFSAPVAADEASNETEPGVPGPTLTELKGRAAAMRTERASRVVAKIPMSEYHKAS